MELTEVIPRLGLRPASRKPCKQKRGLNGGVRMMVGVGRDER